VFGRKKPEEPVEEAVESHEGCRSESPGQRPTKVGDLLVDLGSERSVERCALSPGQ